MLKKDNIISKKYDYKNIKISTNAIQKNFKKSVNFMKKGGHLN